MAEVKFKKENLVIEVEAGTKLSEAIRKAGLSLETPCNCMGVCGKCCVKAVGELSEKTKEELNFTEGDIRLACVAKVLGNVEVELITKQKTLKTINKGYSIEVDINSEIKVIKLENTSKTSTPFKELIDYKVDSISALKTLGIMEAESVKKFNAIIYNDEVIDFKKEDKEVLGVAVDIGTTGLSVYLVNLITGEIINKMSALNPQTEYGGDVISRITYCMENNDGVDKLSRSIREKIDAMIYELVKDNVDKEDIYRIIIAANTTMLHMFLGVQPHSIARAPYRAVFLERQDFKAKELSLHINKEGMLTLLPSASGYVGSDILAGIAAIGFKEKKNNSIFIDIGTNGEIVVNSKGKLVGSSTAAGPALEGMNISCGSRADDGAIDSFSIDDEFNIEFTTIGDEKAKGICGSGLLDVAAALVSSNIVDSTGRFNKDMPEKLKENFRDKKFFITDEVYISQKDIRQIQLAKGAISAGIIMLLKELNITIEEIEEVIIAGAFGYHVNPNSIKEIGLIPKGFSGKIDFVGNSSVEGARLALLNRDIVGEMSNLKDEISVIELSTKEDFQNYFIKELNF